MGVLLNKSKKYFSFGFYSLLLETAGAESPAIMDLHSRHIWFFLVLPFLVGSLRMYGQVEFPGTPLGINQHLKAASVIYTLPPPDPLEISALQESSRHRIGKSLPFAIIRQVNLNPEIHGSWSLEGEFRVWRVHLISPGAYSLGPIFHAYHLEEGVRLFVYDPLQQRVKGAFTSGNNKSSGILPVGHIPGQELVVEMQVPLDQAHYGELELESVSHAFLELGHQSYQYDCGPGEFGCAQECEIDVNCSEGDDWWQAKPSVVRLFINKSSISEYCTGVLINNTAYDGTPYVLTAEHCIGIESHAENTVYQFNYESAECFGEDGPLNMSISGSELLSVGDSIDFSLVQLSLDPPPSYGVVYAGWDRSDFQTTPSTAIHHPWGDVKKITFDFEAPDTPTQPGDVPYADLEDYHYFSYWWIREWDIGSTEGGSSGGPLFNAGKRVIGVLSGGRARCGDSIGYNIDTDRVIYSNVFNFDDYYTRFGLAWDYEKEKGNELAQWLDPLGSDVGTLGSYNPTSAQAPEAPEKKRYQVYPNPASGSFSIAAKLPTASGAYYVVRNMSGALLLQGELDKEGKATLDASALVPGIYLVSVREKGYAEHHKLIISGP
jgi:lysyl endopeptidase